MALTVSEYLFEYLKDYVDTVFFVPGGGAMYLVDALGRSGLNHVSALHEQGAGYMALGYAMQTNGLGVCLVTSGPGATNAITPCAAAWMDSVPVLFISGQVKSTTMIGDTGLRSRGGQEVDIYHIVHDIIKFGRTMKPGDDIKILMEMCIDNCLSGRKGPCWLDIPMDVQNEELT